MLGNNIVIFAPAFALSNVTFASIQALFGPHVTLLEANAYDPDLFKQNLLPNGSPSTMNIIILSTLKGLESTAIKSHTEKIYYFVVNFTRSHLEGTLAHASTDENLAGMQDAMYRGTLNIENYEDLETYVAEEVKMIEEGKALESLKAKARNVEEINGATSEKSLLDLLDWAKIRLQPVVSPAKVT